MSRCETIPIRSRSCLNLTIAGIVGVLIAVRVAGFDALPLKYLPRSLELECVSKFCTCLEIADPPRFLLFNVQGVPIPELGTLSGGG
jgi:hypothetical protein